MAYKIDFTAANYASRSRRKTFLRLLLLAAIGAASWGVYDIYNTYNEPTLDMRLSEYEAVARPIEEMNRAWDEAAKEYNTILPYYRLIWADSATNFLARAAASGAHRIGGGFRPVRWQLATGGKCRLEYRYVFNHGDKAQQAREIEGVVANAITSVVSIATNTSVSVGGVQLENLLNVSELAITADFSLTGAKPFPPKEKRLAEDAAEIAALRDRIHNLDVPDAGAVAGGTEKAKSLMMGYMESRFKDDPAFPQVASAINVAGWFKEADNFARNRKIPVNATSQERVRNAWKKIGEARFPWDRLRELDNAQLTERTWALDKDAGGVKRFKKFLENRHGDYIKKLEPLVDVYNHNDVFNQPLIGNDLMGVAAQKAGLADCAAMSFKAVDGIPPAVLEKEDETFSFSLVRWTMTLGGGEGASGAASAVRLSLSDVQRCIDEVLGIGAGYALDAVRIEFSESGGVSSAVLEGLLPVKKVEPKEKK